MSENKQHTYPKEYIYPAIIENTTDYPTNYKVTFPDFNTVFYIPKWEAKEKWLIELIEKYEYKNQPLPEPSSYKQIKANNETKVVEVVKAELTQSDLLTYANNKGVRLCDLSDEEILKIVPDYNFKK